MQLCYHSLHPRTRSPAFIKYADWMRSHALSLSPNIYIYIYIYIIHQKPLKGTLFTTPRIITSTRAPPTRAPPTSGDCFVFLSKSFAWYIASYTCSRWLVGHHAVSKVLAGPSFVHTMCVCCPCCHVLSQLVEGYIHWQARDETEKREIMKGQYDDAKMYGRGWVDVKVDM